MFKKVDDEIQSDSVLLSDADDDTLMALALSGKTEAFEVLVRRHQQMVYRIAVKYLGDEFEAKDVTQNSFIMLYRCLETYKPCGKFVSFLGRIVLNQCKMAARARKYRDASRRADVGLRIADADMPDDRLLANEQWQMIEAGLVKLSPKLREVLVLRYAGELSYKDIAATLKIRMGTVKSRLFAGLEKMSRLMEDNRQ